MYQNHFGRFFISLLITLTFESIVAKTELSAQAIPTHDRKDSKFSSYLPPNLKSGDLEDRNNPVKLFGNLDQHFMSTWKDDSPVQLIMEPRSNYDAARRVEKRPRAFHWG
ncbi:uncharacterized protein LOC142341074 [Convolutriloba macropyga]|uniref:uncharacterized protein LOC142341074 n=1 Tax=Convolutriloba macropyga TaxID=536237 RepID=UPI003F51D2BC